MIAVTRQLPMSSVRSKDRADRCQGSGLPARVQYGRQKQGDLQRGQCRVPKVSSANLRQESTGLGLFMTAPRGARACKQFAMYVVQYRCVYSSINSSSPLWQALKYLSLCREQWCLPLWPSCGFLYDATHYGAPRVIRIGLERSVSSAFSCAS